MNQNSDSEYLRIAEEIRELAAPADGLSFEVYGPTSEEQIREVEARLGTTLPKSYRAFLLHFAGGDICGREFYGIPTARAVSPPVRLEPTAPDEWEQHANIICDIVRCNRLVKGVFPEGTVEIAGDGGDFRYYLDTAKTDDTGECPVRAWGPGVGGEKVADSFLQYVRMLAKGTAPF